MRKGKADNSGFAMASISAAARLAAWQCHQVENDANDPSHHLATDDCRSAKGLFAVFFEVVAASQRLAMARGRRPAHTRSKLQYERLKIIIIQ
jgi:hypothetical protein